MAQRLTLRTETHTYNASSWISPMATAAASKNCQNIYAPYRSRVKKKVKAPMTKTAKGAFGKCGAAMLRSSLNSTISCLLKVAPS
jgi:hypothetical protein